MNVFVYQTIILKCVYVSYTYTHIDNNNCLYTYNNNIVYECVYLTFHTIFHDFSTQTFCTHYTDYTFLVYNPLPYSRYKGTQIQPLNLLSKVRM